MSNPSSQREPSAPSLRNEGPGAVPEQPAAGALIGAIVVTPHNPRPAQSVRVEVRSPTGAVLEGAHVRVMINGVPGAVRYLQFDRSGPRRLKVLAASGDVRERQTKVVEVSGEPVRYRLSRATTTK